MIEVLRGRVHWAIWTMTLSCAALGQDDVGWPGYQGGPDRNQYSALDQITPENVAQLEVAWTYHAGDGSESARSQIQCNAIVIDDVLYATSPALEAFALDAATGREQWVFEPAAEGGGTGGVNRGVSYWESASDPRVLDSAGANLYSLCARTGEPDAASG